MLQLYREEVSIMINSKHIKTFVIGILCALLLTNGSLFSNTSAQPAAVQQQTVSSTQQGTVRPLSVVNSPKTYLNKKITMHANMINKSFMPNFIFSFAFQSTP